MVSWTVKGVVWTPARSLGRGRVVESPDGAVFVGLCASKRTYFRKKKSSQELESGKARILRVVLFLIETFSVASGLIFNQSERQLKLRLLWLPES